MSGIFLTIWPQDDAALDVLPTTKGGWPHITQFYSGSAVPIAELMKVGQSILQSSYDTVFQLTPENVGVNSFHESSTGKQRYDVLMNLDADGEKFVNNLRSSHPPAMGLSELFMGRPHITHSIHYSQQEAEDAKNKLMKKLPIGVRITGYTID